MYFKENKWPVEIKKNINGFQWILKYLCLHASSSKQKLEPYYQDIGC